MRWTTLLAASLLSTATALGGGARGTVKTKEEGVVEVERTVLSPLSSLAY